MEQAEGEKKMFSILRNGRLQNMEHFEKLVGDIVDVKAGDSVSVDGILIFGNIMIMIMNTY